MIGKVGRIHHTPNCLGKDHNHLQLNLSPPSPHVHEAGMKEKALQILWQQWRKDPSNCRERWVGETVFSWMTNI